MDKTNKTNRNQKPKWEQVGTVVDGHGTVRISGVESEFVIKSNPGHAPSGPRATLPECLLMSPALASIY